MSEHEEPEGYEGEVTVAVDGEPPRTARAALAARFDPLAGHVVWTGRVAAKLAAADHVRDHDTARQRAGRGHRARRLGQHPDDRRRPSAVPGRAAGRRVSAGLSRQRDQDDGGDGGTQPGDLRADQPLPQHDLGQDDRADRVERGEDAGDRQLPVLLGGEQEQGVGGHVADARDAATRGSAARVTRSDCLLDQRDDDDQRDRGQPRGDQRREPGRRADVRSSRTKKKPNMEPASERRRQAGRPGRAQRREPALRGDQDDGDERQRDADRRPTRRCGRRRAARRAPGRRPR